MSSASHAFGVLVHFYRELLNKEAGRRMAEPLGGRGMRRSAGARSRAIAETVEPLERRVMLAADWTVMVYLNGDNNLEAECLQSLANLELEGSTPNVNIVVEMDRSPGYASSYGDWTDTRRGLVAKSSAMDRLLFRFATPLTSIDEKDMGSPETLKDFATWAVGNYPANHYALIIKDHGGGLNGVSFDDTDRGPDRNSDHISVAGVSSALAGVVHPDVLAMDACRMGMTEVAYEWRNSADFLVASEPKTLSHWFYNGIFTTTMRNLESHPDWDGNILAREMVADADETEPGKPTLAAIDLSQMDSLGTALNNLAVMALADRSTWPGISGSIEEAQLYSDPAYRDLGFLLDRIQVNVPTLAPFALAARNALSAAVVANRSSVAADARGLSIYVPNQGMSVDPIYTSAHFAFAKDTQWDEFLREFCKGAIHDMGGAPSGVYMGGVIGPGPGGTLWYSAETTAAMLGGYGMYSPDTGFDMAQPVPGMMPYYASLGQVGLRIPAVTVDSDGHLWMKEEEQVIVLNADGVSQDCVDTGNYYIQEVTSTGVYGPRMAYDPATDGWIFYSGMRGHFTYDGGGFVGITSAQMSSLSSAAGYMVFDATMNSDGNAWFTTLMNAAGTFESTLGRIAPDGTITLFPYDFPQDAWLSHIIAGPDGNVWFTQFHSDGAGGGAINRVAADGTRTIFYLGSVLPEEIVVGPDSNMWFTDANEPVLRKISPEGSILAELPHPALDMRIYQHNLTCSGGQIYYVDNLQDHLFRVAIATKLTVDIAPAYDQTGTTNRAPIKFAVTFTQPVKDFDRDDVQIEGTAGGSVFFVTNPSGDDMTYEVTVGGMTGSGMVGISIPDDVAHNFSGMGNEGSPDLDVMVWYDTTPLTVTVNQAAGQNDPASSSVAKFDIIFNKPVSPFYPYEVTVGGTAPGALIRTLTNPSGDGRTYELTVTGMTGYGTLTASVAAGWADDLAGNTNQASTSADNVVTYSPFLVTPPSVTISQSAGQTDPTTLAPISFMAVFSTEVTDFSSAAVTLSGTAAGAVVDSVIDSGDHKTYTITVSGMTGSGTVIASIGMNKVHDIYGQGNSASTSHDNAVTYSLPGAPSVTVTPTAGQPDPTGFYAFFTVAFNRPVTDFGSGDVVLGGTAPGALTWMLLSSSGQMTYSIRVSGMTGSGTVTASVPAGMAHASTGEANLASTNPDNVVNYEYTRTTAYPTPTPASSPKGIVAGPDGNLWFTEYYGNKIGMVTPVGVVTEYATGTTRPESICVGPDNNLWFTTGSNTRTIGKITTTGVVTLYTNITASNYYLRGGIAAGPDGNLWFTADDEIGKISTSGVIVGVYMLPAGTGPQGIAAGRDGNLWFTSMSGHKIGRITTAGAITWISAGISGDSSLPSITAGPDGSLWFTEQVAGAQGRIGRITTAGVVTEFTTGLSSSSSPSAITPGADGNLWYTGSGLVGRITTAGVITEYGVSYGGSGIAAGPDGKIWYTAPASYGYIVRLGSTVPLPVTIEQVATQEDPTSAQPIHYTIVFGSPVVDLTPDKLVFGGTAAGTPSATITDSGDHMTFDVAVSGLTESGTLVVSLASGSVHDADGNASQNATSADNVVVFVAPDVTPPTVTIERAPDQADLTNALPIHFTAVFSEPVTDFDAADVLIGGTSVGTPVVVDSGDHTTFHIWINGLAGSGTVSASIPSGLVHDLAGNANLDSTSSGNTVTYDVTAPTVMIDPAAGQPNPTNSSPITFTVVFSEPVLDFGIDGVALGGTAPGAVVQSVIDAGDHMTYTVTVGGMTGDGIVIAAVYAGAAHDAAGNANLDSLSTDNMVVYDTVPPTVTINQAAGQTDPATSGIITFTVVFSEPVLDFGTGSVILGGTAPGAAVQSVVDAGDHMTYTVTIGGMTDDGTVIATVPAGAAHDDAGNSNLDSTSTDNVVVYLSGIVPPSVTINQAAGQTDPATSGFIMFTVVFSKPVLDFVTDSVTLNGTAAGASVQSVIDSGDHMTYTVTVGGMTTKGTVIASILAGAVHDDHGNGNLGSTSTDHVVTWSANVSPVVTIDTAADGYNGVLWNGTGSFTDPDDDAWSATVDYGDGTTAVLGLNADKTFALSHIYAVPGDYTITVAVSDGVAESSTTASVHINAIMVADHNLEDAIRQQLGLAAGAPVTQADLESLTQLDASYRGITDLTGLEYATNLTSLQANGNPISDLTPIFALALGSLSLNNTSIGTSGLAGIASHLTSLTHLEVQGCGIGDFSSLSSLTSLQYLDINDNTGATGLDAIGSLTNLQVLYAANTGIPATAIAPLDSLTDLDVRSCGLTDLSFLAGKQLTLLNLGGNPIADVSLLGTQSSLWWLSIDGMGLNQGRIAAVNWSGLSNLSVFTFSGNPIGSLSFLTAMPQLLSVGAWGTGVSDISPLASLTGIHYLVLGSNPITDISPLNSLIALENLNIHDCELTTLGQVQWSNLKGLWGLGAMHNHLSTYTGGADAQIIADLQARGVGVFAPSQYVKFGDAAFEADIRAVLDDPAPTAVSSDDMMGLTSLDLSGMPISSIAGIEYAGNLTFLDLRNTGLNLSPGTTDRARVDLLISRGVAVQFDASTPDITPPTIINEAPTDSDAILASSFNVDVWFSEPVQNVDATDLVLGGRAAASAVVGTPVNLAGNEWRFPVSGARDGGLVLTLGAHLGDITDLAGNSLLTSTWSCNVNVTARIMYSRYPAGGNWDLYVMNPDGLNQENITNDQTANQAQGFFSHDGSRIVYAAANGIWVMNADGTANTQLTTSGSAPIFSPDDSRIVYYTYDLTSSAIHIMNANGTDNTVLSANKDAHPRFSPDGTKIAFDSARDGGLGSEIYVMNVDGTNQTRLTNAPTTLGSYEPCYSPDGSEIVFAWYGYNDAHREIYIMNADGTSRTRLTSGSASKDQPCFSPDGTKIAYTVSAGLSQIYLMNADGTGQTQLTLPGYGSDYASWVIIDKRPPAIRSIVPTGTSPTNATSLQFAVTFRESVWGVAASDFVLATTGTAHGVIASLTGSGASYTVTVNSAGGNGTIGLNLLDYDTIEDQVGNKLGGSGAGNGNFTGQTYTLDNTPPAVVAITRLDANPTNAYQLRFYLRFSESVTGVDKTDFAVATTGTAAGSVEFSPAFDGTGYTVTISNISGDGNLGLNLLDNDSISDALGNHLGGDGAGNGNFTGQVYTIDHSFPTVASFLINDGSAQRSMVRQVTVTFSEAVNLDSSAFSLTRRDGSYPADVSLQLANPSGDKKTYAITFVGSGVVGGSLPDGKYNFSVLSSRVTDPAGNRLYYDYHTKFFRLFGDYDGNRVVNRSDLIALRQAISQPATAAPWSDYDGNGTIDRNDLFRLRARLRRTLL